MAPQEVDIEIFLKEGISDQFVKVLDGFIVFLIGKYFPNLRYDEDDYEDCKQDCIKRVIEALGDEKRAFDPTRSKFKSYVYSLIRNSISRSVYSRRKAMYHTSDPLELEKLHTNPQPMNVELVNGRVYFENIESLLSDEESNNVFLYLLRLQDQEDDIQIPDPLIANLVKITLWRRFVDEDL